MSNFMKNAKNWLGLGTDPYYDDEYGEPDDEAYFDEPPDDEPERSVRPAPAPASRQPRRTVTAGVSAIGAARSGDWEEGDGGVRVISAPGPVAAVPDSEIRNVVRPLPSASKPHVVTPVTFNDVQEVADCFKSSQPVIVNLQGVDRDLSRRLIDFASGLCYGLEGNMERVADQVFLLTPSGARISDDERRRLREHGLADER